MQIIKQKGRFFMFRKNPLDTPTDDPVELRRRVHENYKIIKVLFGIFCILDLILCYVVVFGKPFST